MIRVGLYSYFDRKAHCYGAPFTAVNNDVAVRQFAGLIQDAGGRLAIYDTELYKVGEFDSELGGIVSFEAEFICDYYSASELLKGGAQE